MESDERTTPKNLFLDLDREFNFTLDPCCTESTALCKKFYTKKENGLMQDWSKDVVFMNPPYSAILTWMKKAYDEAQKGATVVCLIISDTSTAYWHEYCLLGERRYIRGRLKFGDNKDTAPFPSVIIIFDPERLDARSLKQTELDLTHTPLARIYNEIVKLI